MQNNHTEKKVDIPKPTIFQTDVNKNQHFKYINDNKDIKNDKINKEVTESTILNNFHNHINSNNIHTNISNTTSSTNLNIDSINTNNNNNTRNDFERIFQSHPTNANKINSKLNATDKNTDTIKNKNKIINSNTNANVNANKIIKPKKQNKKTDSLLVSNLNDNNVNLYASNSNSINNKNNSLSHNLNNSDLNSITSNPTDTYQSSFNLPNVINNSIIKKSSSDVKLPIPASVNPQEGYNHISSLINSRQNNPSIQLDQQDLSQNNLNTLDNNTSAQSKRHNHHHHHHHHHRHHHHHHKDKQKLKSASEQPEQIEQTQQLQQTQQIQQLNQTQQTQQLQQAQQTKQTQQSQQSQQLQQPQQLQQLQQQNPQQFQQQKQETVQYNNAIYPNNSQYESSYPYQQYYYDANSSSYVYITPSYYYQQQNSLYPQNYPFPWNLQNQQSIDYQQHQNLLLQQQQHHHHHQQQQNIQYLIPNHLSFLPIVNNMQVLSLAREFKSTCLGQILYDPYSHKDGNDNCILPSNLISSINSIVHIRIPARYLSADANPKFANREVWGTDVYTDDSDPVSAIVHAGYISIASTSFLPPTSSSQTKNITKSVNTKKQTKSKKAIKSTKSSKSQSVKSTSYLKEDAKKQKNSGSGNYDSFTAKENKPTEILNDCIVTLRILPPLNSYTGSFRHGFMSRTWKTSHDGASFMIEKVVSIPAGHAESFRPKTIMNEDLSIRKRVYEEGESSYL